MSKKQQDNRLDDVRISEGEGPVSNTNDMVDWLFRVLSQGNPGAYAANVLERAAAGLVEASA